MRKRLLIASLSVTVIGILLLALLFTDVFYQNAVDSAKKQLVSYMNFFDESTPFTQESADAFAGKTGARVTLMLSDGTVVADSYAPVEGQTREDREEVREAIASGAGYAVRESDTVGENMVYYCVRFSASAGGENALVRIGVTLGSLSDRIGTRYGDSTEGIVESALDKVSMIERMGYDNLVISIKSSDVLMCVKAHELIAKKTMYPLHVGITEAGTVLSGNIKSAIGLGLILNQGIGDTIRVSLTGDPVEEVKSAKLILKSLGLRKGGIEVVSCPTCGRTQIDLIGLANQVEEMVKDFDDMDLKVAVMGCVVNGPGEARNADIGIAGGIGEGLLIKKGQVIRKVPEKELLHTLRQELESLRETRG